MFRYGCLRYSLVLLFLLAGPETLAEQISVETTECYGGGGFSSFEEHRLFKIQQGDCDNPDRQGEKLYQILLYSSSPLTHYEVLWVTRDEAEAVMAQARENRDYRRDYYSRPDSVVIVQPPPSQMAPAPVPPAHSPPIVTPQTGNDLQIEILDPPLMRSAKQVLSDIDVTERLIVGRVSSSAKLASLSINGMPLETSDKGIFRRIVPIDEQRTRVEIIAVDENGRRDEREFWLVMPLKETGIENPGDRQEKASTFGHYHALVIGINDYAHYRNLETAVNDAQAIESLLKQRYGFSTRLLINPTRYEIIRTISELRKNLTENDNLLIYYAGHGEYDRANLRGHWLPADAEPDSPANWISTVDITDAINRMSAKHIMVVADSCYSGALDRGIRSNLDPGMSNEARERWLQIMAANRVRVVLTSGGLAPVLDGGGGNHSVFANAFIKALASNNAVLDGGRLYQQVRDGVSKRANELGLEQVPEYSALKGSNHELGNFLFVAQSPR